MKVLGTFWGVIWGTNQQPSLAAAPRVEQPSVLEHSDVVAVTDPNTALVAIPSGGATQASVVRIDSLAVARLEQFQQGRPTVSIQPYQPIDASNSHVVQHMSNGSLSVSKETASNTRIVGHLAQSNDEKNDYFNLIKKRFKECCEKVDGISILLSRRLIQIIDNDNLGADALDNLKREINGATDFCDSQLELCNKMMRVARDAMRARNEQTLIDINTEFQVRERELISFTSGLAEIQKNENVKFQKWVDGFNAELQQQEQISKERLKNAQMEIQLSEAVTRSEVARQAANDVTASRIHRESIDTLRVKLDNDRLRAQEKQEENLHEQRMASQKQKEECKLVQMKYDNQNAEGDRKVEELKLVHEAKTAKKKEKTKRIEAQEKGATKRFEAGAAALEGCVSSVTNTVGKFAPGSVAGSAVRAIGAVADSKSSSDDE